jgi:putative FmdB family regulatory protein
MPIYEFECQTCGKRFDELMRLSDPDPAHCPCERQQPVRRCVSAPQFRLAGSGWYETDFKGDKDSKRNLAGDGGGESKAGAASTPDAASKSEPVKTDAAPKAAPTPSAGGSTPPAS